MNDKRIPLTLKVTSTTDLGDNDEDYFTNRGGNTNIHKVLSGGVVVEGQYLVVGYIAPGQTGVEGSLNISAYINSDNIVISDTYDGTESDNMGTTNNWVGNKTVFTTTEWNSLSGSSNSLSFKIRVEANEGIWVDPYTTPNLMNNININRNAVNIKEIRFIEETPLRMQRRYDASVGQEINGTKADLTYQETGKVLAWIEPITVNPTGTSSNLNIKPSFLVNENTNNNLKQIDNETSYILYIASSGKTKWVTGSNLFNGFTSVEKITFENVDSSDVTDMSGMFYNLSSLKDVIGLNKLNTSNVLYMDNMFYGNSSLTSIDLSGMGSDNLVAIGGMFYNCNNLKTIIMKNFNFGAMNFYNSTHGGYTNYYYAFAYLPNVEIIDLTNANTSGVTNMYDMFYSCKKLRSIIGLNTIDTSNVTSMQSMFSECDVLTSINLNNLISSSVTNMSYMFSGCDNLISANLTGLGSANLINVSNMFYNCNALKEIIMKNFNFGQVNFNSNYNYNYAFAYLPNVETIDLTNANTSGVTSMYDMFYSCKKLRNIIGLNTLDTSNVVSMQYMFSECDALINLDLSSFNTSSVQIMNSMFYSSDNLTSIDLSGLGSDNLADVRDMFLLCTSLKNLNMSNFNFGKINSFDSGSYNSSDIFKPLKSSLENIDLSGANFSGPNITTSSFVRMFNYFDKLKSVNLSNANTSKVTTMQDMFYGSKLLEYVNLDGIDTSNVTNMSYMFGDCDAITKLDLKHLNTSKVTTMYYMFRLMDNLEEIDLSGWGNDNLSDTYGMFDSDKKLKKITMCNFNLGQSTDGMFRYCGAEIIDMSGVKTSNITRTTGMFQNCTNLKTIYASQDWDTSNVTSSSDMFKGCTSLVGGNGTVFDSTKTDKTMAVIDTPSTPGYLTLKQA